MAASPACSLREQGNALDQEMSDQRAMRAATVPLDFAAKGPLTFRVRSLVRSRLTMIEVDYGEHGVEDHADFPKLEDTYLVGVRCRAEVSRTSVHGKAFDYSSPAGYTHFLWLSGVDFVELNTHSLTLELLLPRSFMREVAEDLGASPTTRLGNGACFIRPDPLIPRMARRLRPYLDDPAALDVLYADSCMWALTIYVMQRYGSLPDHRPQRGGLTTWQERIAKELIDAHIAVGITLEELASWCGLRVSQFAHAFKQSVGVPPYQWLIQRRVARAKELMRFGSAPLSHVSAECGFADQGHFSRTFLAVAGASPAAWRRQV
jgi:AraC family transcriptional regulator